MLRTILGNVVFLLFLVWAVFRIAHWWPLSDNAGVLVFYSLTGLFCLGKCAVAAVDVWMEWKERR